MIDFTTYEEVLLGDVAEYARAKQGHIYPAGTSTIQISATRGQVGYLTEPGGVATKNVAVIPQAGINPKYFNIMILRNIDGFRAKYQTGINIQEHEIGKLPIQIANIETQQAIVTLWEFMEREEAREVRELEALKKLKQNSLSMMFPK